MDELRGRIARAIAGADSGTLHGVRPCAACQAGDTNQPCDDCLIMADAAITSLGLHEERQIGLRDTRGNITPIGLAERPSMWITTPELNPTIHRYITDWERAPWSWWQALTPPADIAVRLGIVKPIPCSRCTEERT